MEKRDYKNKYFSFRVENKSVMCVCVCVCVCVCSCACAYSCVWYSSVYQTHLASSQRAALWRHPLPLSSVKVSLAPFW